jgi:glycosyltransferase involved in cell wall biosynthesis
MSVVRIWLANQLLRDRVGHHYGYNLAIADAACRRGLRPELVAHRGFREAVPDGVSVCRLFRTDFRANPPAWAAGSPRLLQWLEAWCDRRFAGDLARIPGTGSNEVVFAQMIAPRHFVRWISWLAARANAPTLFLHLGYRPERFSGTGVRHALDSVPAGKRLLLVTDSEKLSLEFGKALNRTVHYLPHILSHDIPVNTRGTSNSGPLNVFVPGNARREKGFLETVAAARAVVSSAEGSNFRFTIQCHSPDLVCSRHFAGAQAADPGIEWIDRPLEDGEYLQRLGEADIILLPYHLDCYAARTSGIFTEARVAGVPVLTTRGSWAGDRVAREGGGWLTPERDARELASVLVAARGAFRKAKTEALAIAGNAREEFNRDNFMEKLLAMVPGEARP